MTDAELQSLSDQSSDDAFDIALTTLFEAKLKDNLAVDTAKGHMHLEGYLLQSEVVDDVADLSSILTGKEIIRIVDGGELVVMFNSQSSVNEIATNLDATTHEDLNDLYVSTELEMASRRLATPTKKPSFLGKLFGQKSQVVTSVEPEVGSMDGSLIELFDAVSDFYKAAATRKDYVITMVRV